MALVTYGSSDDSDYSDDENTQVSKPQITGEAKPTSSVKSLLSSLPPPKSSSTSIDTSNLGKSKLSQNTGVTSTSKSVGSLNLPAPSTAKVKSVGSLNLPAPSTATVKSTGLLNLPAPTVKSTGSLNLPTPSTATVKSIGSLNLPAPKSSLNLPPPKKNQPVKITIPSVPDPDSEEDEPVPKKQKQDTKGTGLFALLPKPKHAVSKESNRILIPYTLTKKQESKPKIAPVTSKPRQTKRDTKPPGTKALLMSYGSDEEDEPTSFFSFGEEKTDESKTEQHPSSSTHTTGLQHTSIVKGDQINRFTAQETTVSSSQSIRVPAYSTDATSQVQKPQNKSSSNVSPYIATSYSTDATSQVQKPQTKSSSNVSPFIASSDIAANKPLTFKTSAATRADAPLDFGSNSRSLSSSSQSYHNTDTMYYNQQYQPDYHGYQEYNQPYTYPEDTPHVQQYGYDDPSQQQTAPDTTSTELSLDEGFRRLQGKKGRKEEIQIIDIQEDRQDYSSKEWLNKYNTEEKEYRSQMSREQLPTSQQRKKHQITYLAHQAKERELELKNSWADNRLTRKQTQAKYGF